MFKSSKSGGSKNFKGSSGSRGGAGGSRNFRGGKDGRDSRDSRDSKGGAGKKRPFNNRQRTTVKFQMPKDAVIDYKELELLKKYISDRGKIFSRRFSGVTAKQQRELCTAIKQARFLGLLTSGSAQG